MNQNVKKQKELQAAPVDPAAMPHISTSEIPKYVQFSLAQAAYNAIQQDFQRPEFQEGYQRWKAEREAQGKG
ncbi:MAG: hypothetical protein LUD79_07415 [Oscillospiraceae bacterium]|nr:hypothetical protein [Oscillospiraceae bacterium]